MSTRNNSNKIKHFRKCFNSFNFLHSKCYFIRNRRLSRYWLNRLNVQKIASGMWTQFTNLCSEIFKCRLDKLYCHTDLTYYQTRTYALVGLNRQLDFMYYLCHRYRLYLLQKTNLVDIFNNCINLNKTLFCTLCSWTYFNIWWSKNCNFQKRTTNCNVCSKCFFNFIANLKI